MLQNGNYSRCDARSGLHGPEDVKTWQRSSARYAGEVGSSPCLTYYMMMGVESVRAFALFISAGSWASESVRPAMRFETEHVRQIQVATAGDVLLDVAAR